MVRLIRAILAFCLLLGAGDALVNLTLKRAGLAASAHQNDQLSYSAFTQSMLGQSPDNQNRSLNPSYV